MTDPYESAAARRLRCHDCEERLKRARWWLWYGHAAWTMIFAYVVLRCFL